MGKKRLPVVLLIQVISLGVPVQHQDKLKEGAKTNRSLVLEQSRIFRGKILIAAAKPF